MGEGNPAPTIDPHTSAAVGVGLPNPLSYLDLPQQPPNGVLLDRLVCRIP